MKVPDSPEVRDLPGKDHAWPAPRQAWAALAMLMAGLFISIIGPGVIYLLRTADQGRRRLVAHAVRHAQEHRLRHVLAHHGDPGVLADRYQRRPRKR